MNLRDVQFEIQHLKNQIWGEGLWPVANYRKLLEEVGELGEAMMTFGHAAILEEYGDVLFLAIDLASHLNIDAEDAIERTFEKLRARHLQK